MVFEYVIRCPFCHRRDVYEGDGRGVEGRCACGAEFWGRVDPDADAVRLRWKPKPRAGGAESRSDGR